MALPDDSASSAEADDTRLRRPILRTALAIAGGSWLGAVHALDRAALCALVGAAIGAVSIGVGACIVAKRHPLSSGPSRRSWPWRGLGGASILALLACAALLRADAWAPPVRSATVDGDVLGRWSPIAAFGDDDLGEIPGYPTRFAVPAGALSSGDLVCIAAGEPAPVSARGPIPGPSAERGVLPPRGVLSDEIVRIARAARTPWSPISTALTDLRRACLERTHELRDPLTGSLVAALLLGETRGLPADVPDLFVRTGTFHVLAISGLQVAMVAMMLMWPLGALLALLARTLSFGRIDLGPLVFRLGLLALFVPVAGAGAPVMRSAIAWGIGALAPRIRARRPFAVACGTRATRSDATSMNVGPDDATLAMRRRADSIALWALALTIECLVRPDAPLSLSVQLSYAATFGLIVGTSPLCALVRRSLPGAGRIAATDAAGRPRSPLWRIPMQRGFDAVLLSLCASATAVLATLPFVWTRFGEWSPVGVIATAACALPTLWILCAGWARIVCPAVVPEALLDAPAHGFVKMLELFDRAPGSPDLLPPRPAWLVVAAVALTFWVLARHGHRVRTRDGRAACGPDWRWLERLTALTWVVLIAPWSAAPSTLELWALDVGSGTCVVFRAPGAGAWVFDAGSRDRPDVAREALLPLLRHWDAGRLSIALSHADRDHDGSLPYLALRLPPTLWVGALPAHCAERLPHTTARVDVGPGAASVLAPRTGASGLSISLERGHASEDNEGSRLLRLRWGADEIVLSGDAEAEGLATWLGAQSSARPLRLLLVPHHGSESELLGALLAATQPAEVWISGPSSVPIRRELDRRPLAWRWTARDGPLEYGTGTPATRGDAAESHTARGSSAPSRTRTGW